MPLARNCKGKWRRTRDRRVTMDHRQRAWPSIATVIRPSIPSAQPYGIAKANSTCGIRTPVCDQDFFIGRIFIFDRRRPSARANQQQAFDSIEKSRSVVYFEDGIPMSIWDVTVCRGFRGFASLPKPHY